MILADDGTVAWWWLGVGAFTTVLVFVASWTPVGRRIWSDFERIGKGGRLVVISVAALVIWGTMAALEPPVVPGASFLLGSATVLVVGTGLRFLRRIAVDSDDNLPENAIRLPVRRPSSR